MKTRFAVLLLALPLFGFTEAPTPAVIRLSDVISAIGPNANSSGSFKAMLVLSSAEVDLYIYRDPYDEIPLIHRRNIAWSGAFAGTFPWLEFSQAGDLEVHSENMSIGRNRWGQTLTITRRASEFYVASFAYSSYDTLDLEHSSSCSFDYLTGGQNEIKPQEILLADWDETQIPMECYEPED